MNVRIRLFEKYDIPLKIKWVNDPDNNKFLHYNLPLEVKKTEEWFEKNKGSQNRYDAIIEVDGVSVGLIGLTSIDEVNRKAEYYVLLGEAKYRGMGVATKATKCLLSYAYETLKLNRVYLYVELENLAAIKCYERIGFKREGTIKNDLFFKGRFVDRYIYGLNKKDFYGYVSTPIQFLSLIEHNSVYVKREDFYPFSFGGNKARKAELFFEEIDRGAYDYVVTYGSSCSNHCRVVANMAAARGIGCIIVSPEEGNKQTYNSRLMSLLNAKIITCSVKNVQTTIEEILATLRTECKHPYFISGGGHGNIGTFAYVECYQEIRKYEKENHIHFDYIFHASGTGTTQAGLVCGQLINGDIRKIVGISIARDKIKGRGVIIDSVKSYLYDNSVYIDNNAIENAVVFIDDYIGNGYAADSLEISDIICNAMKKWGLPLDMTYTGKAMLGMLSYLKQKMIDNKNVLFIHTGGTPLFFDNLDIGNMGES